MHTSSAWKLGITSRIDARMAGWQDGRMAGWKSGRIWQDGRMEGWQDGRMHGRIWQDGRMAGWQDGRIWQDDGSMDLRRMALHLSFKIFMSSVGGIQLVILQCGRAGITIIMAYGSTPYVGMTPKKNGGHITSAQMTCSKCLRYISQRPP